MKKLKQFILLLAAIAMVSCGEKKEEKEQIRLGDESKEETRSSGNNTSKAEEGVVEVKITGNDQMRFNKEEIKVKAGQTVRLTLEHVGQMDESVMGHNFVLLEKGTVIAEFGQAAAAARDNDYIPKNSDAVIAHTEIIGGGESTTIEFEAPAAGTYDFICSFPGHWALMNGKFIVE